MIYKKPMFNDYLKFIEASKSNSVQIEEPLANAYVLRRIQKQYHPRVKAFFKMQPPPYSYFNEFDEDLSFLVGKRRLGAIIRLHSLKKIIADALFHFPATDEPFWQFLFNAEPERVFLQNIPIHFVIEPDHPTSTIKFVKVFLGVKVAVNVCDHKPPHLHIWIPPFNKRDGRYLYPSLNPYMGARPLSKRQKKKVRKFIEKYKNEIERKLGLLQ